MYRRIISITVLAVMCFSVKAQDILFPSLKGFKIKDIQVAGGVENIKLIAAKSATDYFFHGIEELHTAGYRKGRAVIKADICRYSSKALAFGAYSAGRISSFRFVNLGAQGYITEGSIGFLKGDYFVKLSMNSKKENVLHSAETLASRIAAMIPGDNSMPEQLVRFPADGRKTNQETFVYEKILGHSFLGGGFKAEYLYANSDFDIYIIDRDSSEEIRKTAETFIASTGISPVETSDSRFVLSDGYNGTVFLAWKDITLVIISGLARDQADIADRYTSEILK